MKIKSKVEDKPCPGVGGEGRRRGWESSSIDEWPSRVDFELAGRGECLPARFECETPIVALFNRQPFEMEHSRIQPENCLPVLCTLL